MGFVHLHVHSQFSLLDGTIEPGELARTAAGHGMPSVAITDSANLYGAVAFFKACAEFGVKPIIGAELFVQPEGVQFADPRQAGGGYQLLALVKDDTGYRNLCTLVTRGIFDGMSYKPRVDLNVLQQHCEGLIFLTGGWKGTCGRALAAEDSVAARGRFDELAAFLDREHLYLELQDVGLPDQQAICDGLRQIAQETGYQTVITNGVHYLKREDAGVHEVLNAIGMGCSMADPRRVQCPTDQAYFKTEEELREVFPNDIDALERTVDIANRCGFRFDFDSYHFPATTPPDDGGHSDPASTAAAHFRYFYEAFPPPDVFVGPSVVDSPPEGAGTLDGYLRWYTRCGLRVRLERIEPELHDVYRERVETELDIIESMGFSAYFLIVAEFINWSKDHDIPVGPGRGSAAGSLVAYALRITDIDSIRFDLLFERFLNPERVSMPDIDIDFCQDRREEAIEHVRQKYGEGYVSQIITYSRLKARAAIRDVARVLDLSFTEADRIAKLIPDTLGITLREALSEVEDLKRLYDGDPKVRRVINLAMGVEGMCRQTGVHAAGVVIADKPLLEYAPLYRDEPQGGPVVQYDMKSAEAIGLIKFDFLGLKTLDQIRDTLVAVQRNHDVSIDMTSIPTDDPATYALLQKGDALGVFQLESSGMRELLTRLKPSLLDDLVALVALYRPGPLTSGMVDDFVDRKHGRQDVSYPLPILEPILKSTYGTIVYQEQVMQIAQSMAGYSLGEADLLRRAMGKKDSAEMARQRGRFVKGSVAAGIDEEKAGEIFDLLAKFAAYGFNKSHSAAYGYICYQTAYLKAHYRAEYMAALLTSEAANTDKILGYIQDCRQAGIEVLPVCLNESDWAFTVPKSSVEQGKPVIRFGMGAVKNVGASAIAAVVSERIASGLFSDGFDVFDRIDLRAANRRVFENLIKAGAFDFSELGRSALMAGLASAITAGMRNQHDREVGQGSLFGGFMGGGTDSGPRFRFPTVPEWATSQKLAYEHEVLGLFLTGHPMQAYRKDVARFATCALSDLSKREKEEVRILGLPVDTRVIKTKRGDRMAFVNLQDDVTSVEAVFFSEPWARSHRCVAAGKPVLITGSIEKSADGVKIRAKTAELLSDVRTRQTSEVRLTLTLDEATPHRLEKLKTLLEAQRGDCRTQLVITVPEQFHAGFQLPRHSVAPSIELSDDVAALFGRDDVMDFR